MLNAIEQQHLQRAIALADDAVARGNAPFGAVLTLNDEVLLETENTVYSNMDVTQHAEMNIVTSDVFRKLSPQQRALATVFCSTEPCPMCATAMWLAGIRRVVFACSTRSVEQIIRDGVFLESRAIFAHASTPVKVIGPVFEDEALQTHRDYWVSSDQMMGVTR